MKKKINSILFFGIFVPFSIMIIGCAASEPRFRSKETPPKSNKEVVKEYRFSSPDKIGAEEEAAEDDRKVDINSVRDKMLHSPGISDRETHSRDKLLLEVLSLVGTPYSYGGKSENGIDCSMFSCQIYEKSLGIKLPRSTEEQYRLGNKVTLSELKFGDLVFFNTTGHVPSHVGIYLGDDLFAHASRLFGVTISSLQSSYYKKRYVGARRIVE
jgi:cell wall-associated NlpC family hydrolase